MRIVGDRNRAITEGGVERARHALNPRPGAGVAGVREIEEQREAHLGGGSGPLDLESSSFHSEMFLKR